MYKKLILNITPEVKALLDEAAADENIPVNNYARNALYAALTAKTGVVIRKNRPVVEHSQAMAVS